MLVFISQLLWPTVCKVNHLTGVYNQTVIFQSFSSLESTCMTQYIFIFPIRWKMSDPNTSPLNIKPKCQHLLENNLYGEEFMEKLENYNHKHWTERRKPLIPMNSECWNSLYTWNPHPIAAISMLITQHQPGLSMPDISVYNVSFEQLLLH